MKESIRRIIIGGALMVAGWLIIMGAVVGIVPQIIWLAFLAYAITLFGFVYGILGVIMYVQRERK